MRGKPHIAAGIGTALLAARAVGPLAERVPAVSSALGAFKGWPLPHAAAFGALYLFGNLLPDVDNEDNSIGFHLPVEHRKWFHTAYAVALLLCLGFLHPVFCGLGLGYFTHLFWDQFSRMGLCWFLPVSGYRRYPGGAKVKKGWHPVLYVDRFTEWLVALAVLGVGLVAWLW